jgi:hypothetical protein
LNFKFPLKPHFQVARTLKKLVQNDSNVVVVGDSILAAAMLSKGLRAAFRDQVTASLHHGLIYGRPSGRIRGVLGLATPSPSLSLALRTAHTLHWTEAALSAAGRDESTQPPTCAEHAGLGTGVAGADVQARSMTACVLDKFKDKMTLVVRHCHLCLLNFVLYSLTLTEIVDEVLAALAHKVPKVKEQTCKYVSPVAPTLLGFRFQ